MTRKEAFRLMMLGLQRDVAKYTEFRGLLERQFEAALRHDSLNLTAVGNAILDLAEVLDGSHKERKELAAVLAAPRKPSSMADVVNSVDGKPRVALGEAWERLEKIVQQCKTLNTRNASLIMSQFEIMQRVLYGESNTYAGE